MKHLIKERNRYLSREMEQYRYLINIRSLFAGTPRNFFKHIQINGLDATNVGSVIQYSVNVSIVNSIVIVGFHCKQLVVSNVS